MQKKINSFNVFIPFNFDDQRPEDYGKHSYSWNMYFF